MFLQPKCFSTLYDLDSYLGVVRAATFGHGALTGNEEAIPPSFLRHGSLVVLCDVVIQLILFAADGLDVLGTGRWREADTENNKPCTSQEAMLKETALLDGKHISLLLNCMMANEAK